MAEQGDVMPSAARDSSLLSPSPASSSSTPLAMLPVDVLRRMLAFLSYPQQLRLLLCSKALRLAIGQAIPRAGFSGPLAELKRVIPGVRDLSWCPPGPILFSDLQHLSGLRSLKLLILKGLWIVPEGVDASLPPVFKGEGKTDAKKGRDRGKKRKADEMGEPELPWPLPKAGEKLVLPQLEYLEVVHRKPMQESEQQRDQHVQRYLDFLLTSLELPRLKSVDLQCCHGLTWATMSLPLLEPHDRSIPASIRGTEGRPLSCLEQLVLKLDGASLLAFLPLTHRMPQLKKIDLCIGRGVDYLLAVELLASSAQLTPEKEGQGQAPGCSALLRCAEVTVQLMEARHGFKDNKIADLWRPQTPSLVKQAAALLGAFGPPTPDHRALKGLVALLHDPERLLPRASLVAALELLLTNRGAQLASSGVFQSLVPRMVDGILAGCGEKDMGSELHNLLIRAHAHDRQKRDAVNALWEELLSRPVFLVFLLGTLTRPGPRAGQCMAMLRLVPSELLRGHATLSLQDAPNGASSLVGLLVGLVDYVCLREAGAVVRRLASLRLLTDMLHLFPQDAVTQAFRRRFPSLARACVSMLSWEGQEEWASMCLSRARQEPKAYKIHPALTILERLCTLEGAADKFAQVLVVGDVVLVCRLLHALGKSLTPHEDGDSDDEDEPDTGKGRRRRTRGTTAEAKRSRAEKRGRDTAQGAMATVRAQLLDRQDVRAKVSEVGREAAEATWRQGSVVAMEACRTLLPLQAQAAAGTDAAWVLRLLMAKECDAAALCVSFPCRTSRGEDDRPALVDMAYRTLAHMLAPKDTDSAVVAEKVLQGLWRCAITTRDGHTVEDEGGERAELVVRALMIMVLHAGSQTGAEALGEALLQCDVGLRLVGLALRRAEKDRHHFKAMLIMRGLNAMCRKCTSPLPAAVSLPFQAPFARLFTSTVTCLGSRTLPVNCAKATPTLLALDLMDAQGLAPALWDLRKTHPQVIRQLVPEGGKGATREGKVGWERVKAVLEGREEDEEQGGQGDMQVDHDRVNDEKEEEEEDDTEDEDEEEEGDDMEEDEDDDDDDEDMEEEEEEEEEGEEEGQGEEGEDDSSAFSLSDVAEDEAEDEWGYEMADETKMSSHLVARGRGEGEEEEEEAEVDAVEGAEEGEDEEGDGREVPPHVYWFDKN